MSLSAAVDDVAQALRANKLRAIGASWLVGLGAAFAMQTRGSTRRAVSVKLIHSRIYAQARGDDGRGRGGERESGRRRDEDEGVDASVVEGANECVVIDCDSGRFL